MPKPKSPKKPTVPTTPEASKTRHLTLGLPTRANHQMIAGISSIPTSEVPAGEGRGANLYAFEIGDSMKQGVGAVIRVYADSKAEALERARKLADHFFDGTEIVSRRYYMDTPWVDSLRIYLDGDPLRLKHGWQEEGWTMRDSE